MASFRVSSLSEIKFDKGDPVSLEAFQNAPGGWQGRVLRGLHSSGHRVAVKIFVANASSAFEEHMGRPQTDEDMRKTWAKEKAIIKQLSSTAGGAFGHR